MPLMEMSMTELTPALLRRRQKRAQRVKLYVEQVEPAQVIMNLRRQRQKLFAAFNEVVKARDPVTGALDANGIATINGSLIKTQELLLRLAKVPQAPPGSTGKQLLAEARKVLDAEPVEAVDLSKPEAE
jgi:hypothetical protein